MSHEVRVHAELGASGMYRWRPCSGSRRLSRGLRNKTTVYAAEGSVAHEVGEAKLTGEPPHPVGSVVEYEGHKIEVTQEMHDAVDLYVSTIREHAARPGCVLLVEQRLDLSSIHPAMFGTSDAIILDTINDELWVYDYKHGAGIAVDAEDNDQMQFYAVGALFLKNVRVKKIGVCIVQPRAIHVDGPVRRWLMTPAQIFEFIDVLHEAAWATENPDAPLVAGDHCRFCPANDGVSCPEIKSMALDTAQKEFALVRMPGGDVAPMYDPDELDRVLRKIPAIEAWCDRVKQFAKEEAMHGRGSSGHKLVRGRGSRELKNVDSFRTWLELGQGIVFSTMFTPPELKSVAQIEGSLPKDIRKEVRDHHVRSIPGGYVLAEKEDKRPAAQVEAACELQPVTFIPE